MPYWDEAYWGEFYWGADPPIGVLEPPATGTTTIEGAVLSSGPTVGRVWDAQVSHRLLRVDGTPYEITDVDGNGTGLVIVGGSLTEEAHAIPRLQGRIRVQNPLGAAYGLFAQGDVILVEKRLTFPDGNTYGYTYGRLGIVAVRETVESRPDSFSQELELEVIQQAEIMLDFSIKGDLTADAYLVAQQVGLVAPSNDCASVEAIMAYLLVQGGASAIGIEGTIVPTPPFTAQFGAVRISPFVIPTELPARQVMDKCRQLTGVTYWIDWDGTAVLTAAPKSVLDLMQAAPKRTFSETDPNNAVANRVEPSPGITARQLAILQQSSTGTVRQVTYVVPEGSGLPQISAGAGNLIRGQYKRVDASAFPPPALDPNDKQDERTRQLALLESLRGNEITLDIIPDPWFRAGDTAILQYPSYDLADALGWCKRKTDDLDEGDDQCLLQRLFEPNAPGSADVGDVPYTWATQVPRFALPTWVTIPASAAIVQGPGRADLYNATPSTFEGWYKSRAIAQQGGANVALCLALTPNLEAYLSGGTVGVNMNCELRLYDDSAALITSLTPFVLTLNDNAWHHVAIQRESGWCGLWIDGVLKASGSGSFGVTTPTLGGTNSHLGYQGCALMARSLYDSPVTPDVQGEIAFYSWRFSRQAVYPHSNFTALTADFRGNSYSDFPTVVSVWPFLAMREVRLNNTDSFDTVIAWSSTSPLYAVVSGLNYAAGAENPPFP